MYVIVTTLHKQYILKVYKIKLFLTDILLLIQEIGACKYCSANIHWKFMDGHWEPRNENSRRHSCLKRKRNYEAPLYLTKTFCATCLRPISSMQNYVCSCISPVYVSKEQAKYIKNERKNEES